MGIEAINGDEWKVALVEDGHVPKSGCSSCTFGSDGLGHPASWNSRLSCHYPMRPRAVVRGRQVVEMR